MARAPDTPVAAATKVQPAKLSFTEKWLAALLILSGVVLTAILLSAFLARADAWALKSKEVTETTEATTEAGATVTTTVEYSDTGLITGLALGALLVLSGAFFGRLREITLPGGAGLKLGELPPEKEEELEATIGEAVQAKAAQEGVPRPPAEVAEEAMRQARALFQSRYWGVVPEPPRSDLEAIAKEAVDRATKLMGT